MNKLLKNKSGMTLVEVVIAIAVFVVVSSGIMVVMVSSQNVTVSNYNRRIKNEVVVGSMDKALSGKTVEGSTEPDTSSMETNDMDVAVQFSAGSDMSIPSQSKTYTGQHIGIVRIK